MDNQLTKLISFYEEEEANLKRIIVEYLEDYEFLMAHYHSRALWQVQAMIRTLKKLDDKLYDEKSHWQSRIKRLEKMLRREELGIMKDYFDREILRAKEELEKLNQAPKLEWIQSQPSVLDEVLNKLVENKIKNLKLILKRSEKLFLAFNYSRKTLKLTLPYIKHHRKELFLYGTINELVNLGFVLSANESRLILTISGSKQDVQEKTKELLSRMVFEIFNQGEFIDDCIIQYNEKTSK